MAKYGKLESSDDSDDDTVKNPSNSRANGTLSVRRSAKYRPVLSDEENDSSDLSTAPTTPVLTRLSRTRKADQSERRLVRGTLHPDGGSFREAYEAEEMGHKRSNHPVTPARTIIPPLTPSPLFASPLKPNYMPSPNPVQISPSRQLSSALANKRTERAATSSSQHVQDLVAVLAAASLPNDYSQPFPSPRTPTLKRTQPSSPSKKNPLLVRLTRPNNTPMRIDDHQTLVSFGDTSPFHLPDMERAPEPLSSLALTQGSASSGPSPVSSPTNTTMDHESQRSQVFDDHWSGLAQRRADLANAKDAAIVVSDSKDKAIRESQESQIVDSTISMLDTPISIDAGTVEDASQLSTRAASDPGTEGTLSRAISVRRYVDSFLSSLPKIWGGTSVAVQSTQQGEDTPADETSGPRITTVGGEPKEPMEEPGHPELSESSTAALLTARNNATTFTPSPEFSAAPTLVNDKPLAPVPKPSSLNLFGEPPITIANSEPPRLSKGEGSYTADDFAYGTSLMRIDAVHSTEETDDPFFAILRSGTLDTEPLFLPEYDSECETAPLPPLFYPTWRFTGVTVRRIGDQRSEFPVWPATAPEEPNEDPDARERLEINWDDVSDSELSGPALDSYLAIRYYQEYIEEPSHSPRKRKAEVLTESSFDEDSEEEYHHTSKSVSRHPGKRRRLVKFDPTDSHASSSPNPTTSAVPRQITAAGSRIDTPYGLCVDDIDTSSIEIRPARDSLVTTTQICHQCRNSSTTSMSRVQCGNVSSSTDGYVSHRCNKTFCERCLRAWYGFDDHGMDFLKSRDRQQGGMIGSGVGLGIVDGVWICPVCISFCMCTICSRRREVPRTRYRPSGTAVFSATLISRRAKNKVMRQPPEMPSTTITTTAAPSNPIKAVRFAPSRIVPPTPTGWMPLIPTPTPGLDSIYYEATRPCTRDFPTGAPQPTAANHAPTLFQTGATLENDGLEDSFTGSEAGESDADGGDANGGHGRTIIPAVRRNFIIVTPGRKLPSTTKKRHLPMFNRHSLPSVHSSAPLPTAVPDDRSDPDVSINEDGTTSHAQMHLEPASITVDPMDIFGRTRERADVNDGTFTNVPLPSASLPSPLTETDRIGHLDDVSRASPRDADSIFLPDSTGLPFDLGDPSKPRDSERNAASLEIIDDFGEMRRLLEPASDLEEHGFWLPVDADGDLLMEKGDSPPTGDLDRSQASYMAASLQEFSEYVGGVIDNESNNTYESHPLLPQQSFSSNPEAGASQAIDATLQDWLR